MFAGLPKNPFSFPTSQAQQVEDFDLKMRGLNKCFVESAQKLLEKSPAADFSKLFDQYKNHLATFSVKLSKEAEPVKKVEQPVKPALESIKPAPTSTFFQTNVPSKPAMTEAIEIDSESSSSDEEVKAPVFKPFNFGSTSTAKPADTEKTTTFEVKPSVFEQIPKFELPSSSKPEPFTFGLSSAQKPAETKPEPASESTVPAFKPFSFGSSTTSTQSSIPFTFGLSAAPKTEPQAETKIAQDSKPEAQESSTSSVTQQSSQPFSFGLSTAPKTEDIKSEAQASPSAESSNFGFKPFSFGSQTTETATGTLKPFSFGSTTTIPSETTPKPFSFGSGSSDSAKPVSFGSSSTNTDSTKPSFSFGSTSNNTATPSSSIGVLAPLPTFSFGGAQPGFSFTIPPAKGDQSGGEEAGDEIPPEEAESFTLTRTNNEQLKTGAGEENETCQHEERCKVFMMDTTNNGWIDLGVGIFKINRYNNETGKSRVLCRSEGNGKVILNTLVSVPGMDVSRMEGKKEVAMLAIGPEGKPTKYLIRVKTLEQADSLKAALSSEIEYVKSNKN